MITAKDIQELDGRRKYRLYRSGPGDGSTFMECWGAASTSRGDLLAEGSPTAIEEAIAEEGGLDDGLSLYVWNRDEMTWTAV